MPKEKSRNRQRRNVTLGNRRTSVSLEEQVWDGLVDVCRREEVGLDELCTRVETRRVGSSMSSALRVFLLTYFRYASERLAVSMSSAQPGLSEGPQVAFPGLLDITLERFHDEQKAAADGKPRSATR
ncbi:MAG: ribbon-helix-helix domain-containing protein [bacterium]|nr:ribbon-helix-helix domain-containing protein [bacterium]